MNNPSDVENHAHTDSKPQLRSTSVIPIRPGIHHHAVHSVSTARLLAIDLLRGLIIVLMALDHTRGFWGSTSFNPTDLAYTTPAWFFTRWITHFCAPLFIVLTGVSAYLYGEKVQSRAALQRYLCSRGIWLIFLEISVINLSWQFAYPSVFLQVIWVIGCSMLMLALLIYLPRTWLLLFSLTCIGLHNLLDDTNINQLLGNQHWIWNVLHQKGHIPLAEHGFFIGVTYPMLPWFAVMALGYCLGALYNLAAVRRQQRLLWLGAACIGLFALLRANAGYGDPTIWQADAATNASAINNLLAFLNTTKYPPSLQYLCMTLGPGLLLLAAFERVSITHRFASIFRGLYVFGSVPLFFYLIHISFLNLCAHLYAYLRYDQWTNFVYGYSTWPAGYAPDLVLVYAAWFGALLLLYWPCKWYGRMKRQSKWPVFAYL
jgi:uncharacterized membrane protein